MADFLYESMNTDHHICFSLYNKVRIKHVRLLALAKEMEEDLVSPEKTAILWDLYSPRWMAT